MSSRIIPLLFLSGSLTTWIAATGGCDGLKGATIAPSGNGGTTVKPTRTGGSATGGSASGGIPATGGSVTGGQGGIVSGTGGKTGGGGAAATGGTTQSGGSGAGGTTNRDAGVVRDSSQRRDTVVSRDGDAGPVACDDTTSNSRLGVWYYTDSTGTTTQDVQVKFDVINFTALSAQLSQVTVRYWFTDEVPGTPNILAQYYVPPTISSLKTKFITLSPPRKNADTVLEFSFVPNPDAGASFVETSRIDIAFHKDNYKGTYDLSNDYSVDPKLTKTLGKNPKITAYINGVLAWGCEPEALPPTPDAGPDVAEDPGSDDAKNATD